MRDDDGNTVVEFALVAPLFFTSMLAIFEVAMLFGTSVVLDGASGKAARALRTGKVFISSLPPAGTVNPIPDVAIQRTTFEDALCDNLLLIRCSEVSYNVASFDTFLLADGTVFCNSDGAIQGSTGAFVGATKDLDRPAGATFDVGGPTDVVVVTIVYPYRPLIPNPLLYVGRDSEAAAESACGGLSMQSIYVFQNEPFPTAL